uniref:Uncharacterized protein n=1 Tax=Oryza glumipatula TaxID=40148 RepID=A0A0E0BJR0_9ORYZ
MALDRATTTLWSKPPIFLTGHTTGKVNVTRALEGPSGGRGEREGGRCLRDGAVMTRPRGGCAGRQRWRAIRGGKGAEGDVEEQDPSSLSPVVGTAGPSEAERLRRGAASLLSLSPLVRPARPLEAGRKRKAAARGEKHRRMTDMSKPRKVTENGGSIDLVTMKSNVSKQGFMAFAAGCSSMTAVAVALSKRLSTTDMLPLRCHFASPTRCGFVFNGGSYTMLGGSGGGMRLELRRSPCHVNFRWKEDRVNITTRAISGSAWNQANAEAGLWAARDNRLSRTVITDG